MTPDKWLSVTRTRSKETPNNNCYDYGGRGLMVIGRNIGVAELPCDLGEVAR